MTKIPGERTLFVDCDDTLVMWDLSKYPDLPRIQLDCYGPVTLIPNQKNINLVKKFSKLGYTIVVWSQTGVDWAETVAKAVGIEEFVDVCISKPTYYLDDLSSDAWLDRRIYREPA